MIEHGVTHECASSCVNGKQMKTRSWGALTCKSMHLHNLCVWEQWQHDNNDDDNDNDDNDDNNNDDDNMTKTMM